MLIRMLASLGGEYPAEGETCEKADGLAARLIQGGYAEAVEPEAAEPEEGDA